MIRYAIQMKNGDYLKADFAFENAYYVKVSTTDLPFDGDLYRNRETTERALKEMLSGESFLPVLYDDSNPPVKVVEVQIEFKISDDGGIK